MNEMLTVIKWFAIGIVVLALTGCVWVAHIIGSEEKKWRQRTPKVHDRYPPREGFDR